jgi:hypothetical protein
MPRDTYRLLLAVMAVLALLLVWTFLQSKSLVEPPKMLTRVHAGKLLGSDVYRHKRQYSWWAR